MPATAWSPRWRPERTRRAAWQSASQGACKEPIVLHGPPRTVRRGGPGFTRGERVDASALRRAPGRTDRRGKGRCTVGGREEEARGSGRRRCGRHLAVTGERSAVERGARRAGVTGAARTLAIGVGQVMPQVGARPEGEDQRRSPVDGADAIGNRPVPSRVHDRGVLHRACRDRNGGATRQRFVTPDAGAATTGAPEPATGAAGGAARKYESSLPPGLCARTRASATLGSASGRV